MFSAVFILQGWALARTAIWGPPGRKWGKGLGERQAPEGRRKEGLTFRPSSNT